MNLVIPIFFCAVIIGLFAPRKMTPTLWGTMVFVILFTIIKLYLQADKLIAAAGGGGH